ncbi:hypothetical protein J3D54_004179 [Pseudomonas sp. GGS8]|uniref:hypothetical protein n=1 Tax=Pseudomonas sp. GGS8 TaxID=2817892 RepID=UPI0020A1B800|nr:hypothetical protein [Pseudomonas sp. GGS8]MCP1445047.1 hypothetical protein [Pseudomonas sp. GGS8]
MDRVRDFFVDFDIYIYIVLVLVGFIFMRVKRKQASFIFVWFISFPLTIYCCFVWAYGRWGREWLSPEIVVFELLAYSQIGWVGGACTLVGGRVKANVVRKIGLWISIGSVVSHGLFIMLMLILGSGS